MDFLYEHPYIRSRLKTMTKLLSILCGMNLDINNFYASRELFRGCQLLGHPLKHGIVLIDQEAMVVLLLDGHELEKL